MGSGGCLVTTGGAWGRTSVGAAKPSWTGPRASTSTPLGSAAVSSCPARAPAQGDRAREKANNKRRTRRIKLLLSVAEPSSRAKTREARAGLLLSGRRLGSYREGSGL